jgi:hypothetical protein
MKWNIFNSRNNTPYRYGALDQGLGGVRCLGEVHPHPELEALALPLPVVPHLPLLLLAALLAQSNGRL